MRPPIPILREPAIDGAGFVHLRSTHDVGWSVCRVPWCELAPTNLVRAGSWLCGACWPADLLRLANAGEIRRHRFSWDGVIPRG